MQPAKPWYTSKSLISAVVGLFGWGLNLFHVNVADLLPGLTDALVQWVSDIFTLAGFVGAIVGRIQAAHILVPSRAAADAHNDILALNEAQIAAPAAGASASTSSAPNPNLTDRYTQ